MSRRFDTGSFLILGATYYRRETALVEVVTSVPPALAGGFFLGRVLNA